VSDLRLRLSQNLGPLLALGLFVLFYGVYNAYHPKGFTTTVLIQNANESLALVLAAMAQTIPILAGGLDLSVGAVMTLTNCLASHLVVGGGWLALLGALACLAFGTLAGLVNGLIVVHGRIQPIIATLATGAVYTGFALFLRPTPGGDIDQDLSWAFTNDVYELAATYGPADVGEAAWFAAIGWIPVPLALMVLVILLVWLPFRASVTGRTVYAVGSAEGAAYMSGLAIDRAKLAAFTLAGFFAAAGGPLPRDPDLLGQRRRAPGRRLHAQLDRGRRHRRHLAHGRLRGRHRLGHRALVIRAISFNFRIFDVAPAAPALVRGDRAAGRRLAGCRPASSRSRTGCSSSDDLARPVPPRQGRPADRDRQPVRAGDPGARQRLHPGHPGHARLPPARLPAPAAPGGLLPRASSRPA
jgi:ribose transport system permease protein